MTNYDAFCAILGYDIAVYNRIKSIVNVNEKTPSLYFYYNNDLQDYYFKDFSSGEHGGPIKFLMLRDGLTYREAKDIIDSLSNNNQQPRRLQPKLVTKNIQYDIDSYNADDIAYWDQYNIPLSLLIKHDVYPVINFSINGYKYYNRFIGYFDRNGNLLQVYAPANSIYNSENKKIFFNCKSKILYYLDNNTDKIILTKSKKDLIVLDSLYGDMFSYAAFTSETYKLENNLQFLMIASKYKEKYINFDNDKAGREAMKHLMKYSFKPLLVNKNKDISDAVKWHKQNNKELDIDNIFLSGTVIKSKLSTKF